MRKIKHGLSKTRFYHIHAMMLQRCKNKKLTAYENYGGRGITVCDRWHIFENFKTDMYDSYLNHVEEFGEKDTSIDRINSNGNYEPSNCRWATQKEQGNNTRATYRTAEDKDRYEGINKTNPMPFDAYKRRKKRGYDERDMKEIPLGENVWSICYREYLQMKSEEFSKLPQRYQEFMKVRYGLEDNTFKTYKETGEHFGVSAERATQIISQAESKLFMMGVYSPRYN